MLRRVHLHGRLGKLFGRGHDLAIDSPAEAVRALAFQLPGFAKYIRERNYVVSIGDAGTVLGEEQLPMVLGRQRDIHITPAGLVAGIETILLGATLLFTAVAAVAVLSMPSVPTAASREEATKTASFIFDGPENTTEQGHPVQLVYGRHRVGSVVGSGGISTTDVNEASVGANPTDPDFGQPGTYDGYVGSTPGFRGGPRGDNWVGDIPKGGKGGGGGQQRAAQEDPNTLQSQATAKILDIIGEGEIVGLVDGLKSIYFDETPLQNPDGTFNFAGVAVEQRFGLPDQDFIPGFTQTENSEEIGTQVRVLTGPVTRSITDEEVTVARVTIRIPQLFQQDTTNGDLKASSVSVKVSVQADGGGFSDVTTMVFNGKTNSGYQRSVDVRLPNGTQRDVRVTRLTPDSQVASLSNETHWDLLTEVVEAKLSYPDTALIGLTVDARQFGSSIPTRSYEIDGLIIEVPTNYDPVTRIYAGLWDGTFKRAYCNNPAWVLRDIIVNRRYGLGTRIIPGAVDIWGLYAIAQYCDGLVPDGFGGQQPRHTINCCIKNPASAYDVIASIASAFRGWVYWGSGSIVAAQDRPEDPSLLITRANVAGGRISYGRVTPIERRRSVAVVYWNDPEDGYRLTPEIVEDADLIRRIGRREGEKITAYGKTNRGEANRAARWLLEDERPSSNATASYEVGDDHGFAEPGRIAVLADPMFTQNRRGGRVRAAGVDSVTIDAPFAFAADQDYSLRVMLPNGTVSVRAITNAPGTATVVALDGEDWAVPPNAGAVWTIESDQVANRQFRIRQIMTDEPPYAVRAVVHDPTKYERVELGRDIDTPNFLDLPSGQLGPPGDIDVFEFLLGDGDAAIPCVQVSWRASTDARVTFYQAQYRRPGGNWEPFADGLSVSREVRNAEPGDWSFRVRALDSLGRKTTWIQKDEALDGQVDGIPNVTGLAVQVDDEALQSMIVWVKPNDHRPLKFEVLYDPAGVFANAFELGIVDTQEWPVSAAGTYWVRSQFINVKAASPPSVTVGPAQLPTVAWGVIADRPLDLEDLDPGAALTIDQLLIDVDDLIDTYGSTEAAAASAAAAQAAEAAALGYRNTAATHASNASGSATAASGSANNAATSATNAGTSAAAALADRTAAQVARAGAETAQGAASGAASGAAGSAANALIYQRASAAYSNTIGITANGDFSSGPELWTPINGEASNTEPFWLDYGSGGYGKQHVWRSKTGLYGGLAGQWKTIDPNRRWHSRTEFLVHNSPKVCYAGIRCRDSANNDLGNVYFASVAGQSFPDGVRQIKDHYIQGIGGSAPVFAAQPYFPPGTSQISEIFLMNYVAVPGTAAGGVMDLERFYTEDVTESTAATTAATAAESSSASASANAALAQSSATLAASVAGNTLNDNPVFSRWTNAAAQPDGWVYWSNNNHPDTGRVNGGKFGSPYSYYWGNLVNENAGLQQVKPGGPGYYVLEATIRYVAGFLNGAGLFLSAYTSDDTYLGGQTLHFATDPATTGTNPNGYGGTYTFSKLVQFSHPDTFSHAFYLMHNWVDGFGPGNSNAAKGIYWYSARYRPATREEIRSGTIIPSLEATVATQAIALADLDGRTLAYWAVEANAGAGTAAFIAARAEVSGGSVTSDVSFGAREVHVYNATAGAYKKAMSVVAGNVTVYGDLRVGGSILIGNVRVPIGLEQQKQSVYDGQAVDYGGSYGTVPDVEPDFSAFPALGSGESYLFRMDNHTPTGGTARVRKQSSSALTTQTAAAGVAGSGGPTRVTHKPTTADAYNGRYTFRAQGNMERGRETPNEPPYLTYYLGYIEFQTWFKPAATGVWTAGPTYYVNAGSGAAGVFAYDKSFTVEFGTALGQTGDYEFGLSIKSSYDPGADTLTAMPSVTYQTSGATESTATPGNSPLLPITIKPKNAA